MSDLQSPTVLNPRVLIPVNPAIESYMGSLLSHTDHSVLIEMEKCWGKRINSRSLVV
jgi:caffeoyl-CoA O-methyltransferase